MKRVTISACTEAIAAQENSFLRTVFCRGIKTDELPVNNECDAAEALKKADGLKLCPGCGIEPVASGQCVKFGAAHFAKNCLVTIPDGKPCLRCKYSRKLVQNRMYRLKKKRSTSFKQRLARKSLELFRTKRKLTKARRSLEDLRIMNQNIASSTLDERIEGYPGPPRFTKAHQIVTLVTKKEARGATKATENADTAPNVGHHYAIPLYGRLEPFQGDGSAWPIYEEQVGVFFRANDIPVEKQRDIFLASCGTRVLGLLLDLLNPATPHDKSLGELFATLRSHFSPAPSTLMERFRFNNRSHRGRETLGQFVAALRGLASGCAFGEQLDSLLRDCFACGINDPAMQTRLLELPDSSLDDAVKAALAMEAAAGSPSTESAVNKMATRCDKCSRCGGDHPPSKCQFAEAECFACGRTGHIARACRGGTADGRKQPSSSTCSAPVHGQVS
ncbi:hypothetical protein MRX96_019312 [Rhipicephalus microplus]